MFSPFQVNSGQFFRKTFAAISGQDKVSEANSLWATRTLRQQLRVFLFGL
ncbi:hypothetical protein [Moorena sp. SIO3I6]|nr:hypothetical protein [Moorena sp. SIO3I6]